MKPQIFNKQFNDYDTAFDFMKMKNRSFDRAGNKVDILCVVPGHEGDNYAVVDLKTAIELGLGYVWSIYGWVQNPWEN